MTSKAKGSSVRQELSDLSHKLKVPYQNIETAFLIERLLARLVADQTLREHLVFKGGFVGLRIYQSQRYTVDLDALVVNATVETILERTKEKAESDIDDGVWFRFEDQLDLVTQGEYGGIRQVYRSGIGEILKNLNKAQKVHFDVGIGDPITPSPIDAETQALIPSQEHLSWSVYPIETMIAEKMHALIAHGDINSRAKDVYDLATFLPKADAEILGQALKRCFEFRETELPTSWSTTLAETDTKSLQRGWVSATASVPEKPDFETSYQRIITLIQSLERSFLR